MRLLSKFLIAFTPCFLLTSCGDVWLGNDKELNLQGERVSLVARSNDLKVNFAAAKPKVPTPRTVTLWPISGANSKQTAENISFGNFSRNYKNNISFNTSNNISVNSEPVITPNAIYIIDSDGNIVSKDSIGSEVWTNDYFVNLNKKSFFDFFSSNFVNGSLSISGTTLYATGGYNVVVALDSNNGSVLWNTKLSSPTRSAPLDIGNNTLAVQTIDNKIFALDKKNGEILWAHFGIADDLSILAGFSLDAKNHKLVFQYTTGEIFAVDSRTGEDIWSDSVSSPLDSKYNEGSSMRVASAPQIVNNMAISYGSDGFTAAFDLSTGANLWKKEFAITKPFWTAGEVLYAINRTNQLFAVDVKTGNVLWLTELNSSAEDKNEQWTAPTMINSQIVTISSSGLGMLFDAHTGRFIESINLPKNIAGKPAVVLDKLYLTSSDGNIYVF